MCTYHTRLLIVCQSKKVLSFVNMVKNRTKYVLVIYQYIENRHLKVSSCIEWANSTDLSCHKLFVVRGPAISYVVKVQKYLPAHYACIIQWYDVLLLAHHGQVFERKDAVKTLEIAFF